MFNKKDCNNPTSILQAGDLIKNILVHVFIYTSVFTQYNLFTI